MNPDQQWRSCPRSIEIDDGMRRAVLTKSADYYAIEGSIPSSIAGAVVDRMEDGLIIVRAPPPDDDSLTFNVLPVYSAGKGYPLAVATGRVFLRLEGEEHARSHAARFASLGFDTEEIPAYAPGCAWLVPRSGFAADALRRLEELRALEHVAHVEPELLRRRTPKVP